LGGTSVVASQHGDLDSAFAQFGDGNRRRRPRCISNGDETDDLAGAPHVNHGASRPLQSLGLRSELADIEFLSVHQPAIPQQYRFAVDLGPRTHALDVLEALLHRNGKPLCTPHNGLRQRVVRTLLHRRSGGEHGVGPHAFAVTTSTTSG